MALARRRRMRRAILSILLVASAACAADDAVGVDEAALVEGSPDAIGLLRFLNDASTTVEVLDDQVPLDRRAAENLIAARPFSTVAQVDAVKYVGEAAMARLVAYARANGFVPADDDVMGTYEGVTFTVAQATAVLRLVNEESPSVLDVEVGLDSRAVTGILNARPVATMTDLAAAHYVGTRALELLKAHVSVFIPEPGERLDCRGDFACAAGERCYGRVDAGTGTEIGKCAPATDPAGTWDECSDTADCAAGLFCSGLTWNSHGWCSPSWMQDTFYNTTRRYLPADSSVVATGVVVYGQASVPMDMVVDIHLTHANPHALLIELVDPSGTEAVLWNGPGRTGQPFPTSFVVDNGISRDDMVNGRWLLRVTNVRGSGTGNLLDWQLWISSRWD